MDSNSSWLAAPRARQRKIIIALALLAAAMPAYFASSWVLRYGVDVPTKDDWEMAPLILKAHSHTLRFADLFEQQQEARTVLPKAIFILSASGAHWNVRNLMLLSVAVCAATAAGIYRLLLRSGMPVGAATICFWLAALLIFSAAQFELWLWASGFPSFMPAMFLVAALNLLETKFSMSSKFALCALCALASSFTLPHGLLLWGLTFPVLLLGGNIPNWARWTMAWCALTALTAAVYFHGYAKPSYLPEFAPAVSAADYARYFFAFLGGEFTYSLGDHRPAFAMTTGLLLAGTFLACGGYVLAHWRDPVLRRRTLPWFAIGGYSIGSAFLAMLGRVAYGIDSALSSRYVTFSLYLTVAVIALVALISGELLRARPPFLRALYYSLGAIALSALFMLYDLSASRCLKFMEGASASMRLLQAAITFCQAVDTSRAIQQSSNPAIDFIRAHAAALDEWKLLRPRLIRSSNVTSLAAPPNEQFAAGRVEEIKPLDQERARASGFALLPGKGRTADAVVLTYDTPTGDAIAFAMSEEVINRREIARELHDKGKALCGWSATFPRTALPTGAQISAWAIDAKIPKLYRLEQNPSP